MAPSVRNWSVALIVALSFAAFWPGRAVAVPTQLQLLGVLLNVSGVVLAISGIWAGLVFPDALKVLLGGSNGSTDPLRMHLARHLFASIKVSAVVVAATLLAGPLVEVVRQWPWAVAHYVPLRGVSFALLCAATLSELLALLMALGFGDAVTGKNSGGDVAEDATQKHWLRQRAEPPTPPPPPPATPKSRATAGK
ncbi:MAG: hypothetical protein K8J09_06440 [Planctomycetes bacterium]|nr:hypothetical protein [Planctomycetota bacterium]